MKQPFEIVVVQHSVTVLRVCRALPWGATTRTTRGGDVPAAMHAYPERPGTANVEAWVVTIARWEAIDVHRAAKRNPVPAEELPEAPNMVGNPRALCAVGVACVNNPPVVVPCHRVLRADGSLGGYIGGHEAKTTLLELEAAA